MLTGVIIGLSKTRIHQATSRRGEKQTRTELPSDTVQVRHTGVTTGYGVL
jgi:hypothetical protein